MRFGVTALLINAKILAALVFCAPLTGLMADEVRPAYLELRAAEQGGYHVLWKQPVG
jgi:hypothetical protein